MLLLQIWKEGEKERERLSDIERENEKHERERKIVSDREREIEYIRQRKRDKPRE